MISSSHYSHLLVVVILVVLPLVQSNSLGMPSMCNARNPALGCSLWNRNSHGEWDAQDCGAGNGNKLMFWTREPQHAPELFTLDAIDGACEYVPGEFITLNLIQHDQNILYRGAMLYAVNNTDKDTKVGGWHIPLGGGKKKFWTPWADEPGHECGPVLMHADADVKSVKEVLRFRAPPAGTGSITIRCLLKVDVANAGAFFWPNSEDLVLHEAPLQPQKWTLGAAGQSCSSACASFSRTCDAGGIDSPADRLLAAIDGVRECRLPLLSSCNTAAPFQHDKKELCFYRDSDCKNRTAKEACAAKPQMGERRFCACKGGLVRNGVHPASETKMTGDCASNAWISHSHPEVRPACCHRKPALPKKPQVCKEALVGNTDESAGASYAGCQTTTLSGKTCQKWTAQEPHRHDWSPISTPGKGLGDHNYCRNPDSSTTIWCYTSDSKMRWDYCEPRYEKGTPEALLLPQTLTRGGAKGDSRNGTIDESKCDETVKYKNDAGYRGCQAKTGSGRTCQKWTSQAPHKHSNMPAKDALTNAFTGLGNHNYCRNPDLKKTIWCYTTDPNMRFEYCTPVGFEKPIEVPTVVAHYVGYHGGCRTSTQMSPPLLRVVQDVATMDACKQLCAATYNCGALEYCTPAHIGICKGVCRLLPGPTSQYTWGNGVQGLACFLRMENETQIPIRHAQWSEHAYIYIGSVDQEKWFPKGDFNLAKWCIDGSLSKWCNLHDNSHEQYKSRNKYLMLDFGSPREVSQVRIFPHVFPTALAVFRYQVLWPAFELWIGDVPHNPWKNKKCFEGQYYGLQFPYIPRRLESVTTKKQPTYDVFVNCNGVGRYIFLVLPGARMALRLREIMVYGRAVPPAACKYFNVGRGCAGKRCANLHPQGWGKAQPGFSAFAASGPFVNGATMTGDVGGPMQCAENYIASGAMLTCSKGGMGMATADGQICTKCKMEEWNPPETARSVSWKRAKFGLRHSLRPYTRFGPQVGYSCSQLDTCAGVVITQDDKTTRDGKHWFQMDAGVAAPIGGVVVQRPNQCNHVSEFEVLTSRDGQKWTQALSADGKKNFFAIPKAGHNYCRSIGHTTRKTIWCYTTSGRKKWDYCEPLRQPTGTNCNETLWGPKGMGYRGCQNKTRTGRTCQGWDSQYPRKHSVYGLTNANYKFRGFFQKPVFARYVRLTKLKFEGRCQDSNGRFGLISCRSGPAWKKVASHVNSTCSEENNNLIKVDWTVSQQPYDRLDHCKQFCVNEPGCQAIFLPERRQRMRLDASSNWVTGCFLFRECGMDFDSTQRDRGDASALATKPWPWVGDTYEMQKAGAQD